MRKIFLFIAFIFFFFTASSNRLVHQVYAADARAGQTVIISSDEKNLHDLYLFGQLIRVDAPVTNDVVAAGQDVAINSDVSGSIIAAGSTVAVKGNTGNTVRAAGGTVTIDGKVANDLVTAGGSISVSKNASISGDLLANGGQITIDGPVAGKAQLNGGNVIINSTINGNVEGNVGKLTLGPDARINGNLTYSSSEKAAVDSKAMVKGNTTYHYVEQQKEAQQKTKSFVTLGSFYKLLADIIISILLILIIGRLLQTIMVRMTTTPVRSGAIGFAYLLLFPAVSLVLLVLIWLGIASFLFYVLSIIFSIYVVKIFTGWIIIRWYEKNLKNGYLLDWKAGIVGPVVVFLLLLIPVIGWFVVAIIFFVSLGALLEVCITPLSHQKLDAKTIKRK